MEFEDPMFELMQEEELEEEYGEMTPEQEREMTSQLMPREIAEYWETTKFYQVQASVMIWKNSRVPNFFLFPLTKFINYF